MPPDGNPAGDRAQSRRLKGDYQPIVPHYYPVACVRRRVGGYYVFRGGDAGGGVGIFAGPDYPGALLRVWRNAHAPLKFGGLVDRTSQGADELGCLVGKNPMP